MSDALPAPDPSDAPALAEPRRRFWLGRFWRQFSEGWVTPWSS